MARRPVRAALALALSLLGTLGAPAARAADACDPKDELVAFPYVARLAPCLLFLRDALGHREALDRPFVRRLVVRAVTPRPSDLERKASLALVPGVLLADLAVLLDDEPLMGDVVGFARTARGAAEIEGQRALARLYALRAPQVLKILARRSESEQRELVDSLAKGLTALLFPHLDAKNAPRMILGVHWELLDEEHPQRRLATRVEDAVLEELE
jgi:hypothetical protein